MEVESVLNGNIKLKDYGKDYSGKHNGWAYQFLNNNYEGIHLGVCCKDFLQDIVWSELTKKSMLMYGQTSNYTGTFDNQENLILCLYPYTIDINRLTQNELFEISLNLQGFLNDIESLRNYNLSTVDFVDNKFIIHFSKQWIELPLIFSAFTLFCRIGFYYNGKLEEYISNLYNNLEKHFLLDNCDRYYISNNYNSLLIFIYNQCLINQKTWNELTEPSYVHNSGLFTNIKLIKYEYNKKS